MSNLFTAAVTIQWYMIAHAIIIIHVIIVMCRVVLTVEDHLRHIDLILLVLQVI